MVRVVPRQMVAFAGKIQSLGSFSFAHGTSVRSRRDQVLAAVIVAIPNESACCYSTCAKFELDFEGNSMTRPVQHSAKSNEHYGPDFMRTLIRGTFGRDADLDPASCSEANMLIGASQYYTQEQDGLSLPWFGAVYLNPPGGRIKYQGQSVNQPALWYATLAHRFALELITEALFVAFNLELPRHTQSFNVRQPFTFPYVLPRRRIDFWKPGGTGIPVPQGSPAHPSAIIYMGPHVAAFATIFKQPLPGTLWEGGQVYGIG